MAFVYERNELNVERTGISVTVANNDVARLMYYLHCVCTSIDCNDDPDIQRFTNYNNWSYLSDSEQRALLVACYTFSPDVFNNKVFFHSDELCGSRSNEFYRINQVRHQLVAAESIVIAGQTREVNQIMVYKMQWMRTYYFDPMERLVARLSTSSRAVTYGSTYTPRYERAPITYTRPSTSSCTCGRICFVIYCIVFVMPTIIGIIVTIIKALI